MVFFTSIVVLGLAHGHVVRVAQTNECLGSHVSG